jgi:hypothetical protein
VNGWLGGWQNRISSNMFCALKAEVVVFQFREISFEGVAKPRQSDH